MDDTHTTAITINEIHFLDSDSDDITHVEFHSYVDSRNHIMDVNLFKDIYGYSDNELLELNSLFGSTI